MKEPVKKNSGVDWALMCSLLFWITVIAVLTTLISTGRTKIPKPDLEVSEASASQNNLVFTHRDGDPVRFANTMSIWTPDISSPSDTREAGTLVMTGEEIKQGRVSKLEPGEMAKLAKDIPMEEGSVGRIIVRDLMSDQQIFSQTVKITK